VHIGGVARDRLSESTLAGQKSQRREAADDRQRAANTGPFFQFFVARLKQSNCPICARLLSVEAVLENRVARSMITACGQMCKHVVARAALGNERCRRTRLSYRQLFQASSLKLELMNGWVTHAGAPGQSVARQTA